jgi:hypothetical protein
VVSTGTLSFPGGTCLGIYLSPDDSRLREMETNLLTKLRRIMPNVRISYEKVPNLGPFGAPEDDRYGLMTYEYQGRLNSKAKGVAEAFSGS